MLRATFAGLGYLLVLLFCVALGAFVVILGLMVLGLADENSVGGGVLVGALLGLMLFGAVVLGPRKGGRGSASASRKSPGDGRAGGTLVRKSGGETTWRKPSAGGTARSSATPS